MDSFVRELRNMAGKAKSDYYAGAENVARTLNEIGDNAINSTKKASKAVEKKATKVVEDAVSKGKQAFSDALNSYFGLYGLGYKDGQVYSPSLEKAIQEANAQNKGTKAEKDVMNRVIESLQENSSTSNNGDDDYSSIVKIAQGYGYTPSDAEVTTVLENLRGRKIIAPTEEESDDDIVEYTYKPGDSLGQVLLTLGLSDGSRLWGSDGDVDFYTQQLREQGVLDSNGNVKIGVPFKLRRRK